MPLNVFSLFYSSTRQKPAEYMALNEYMPVWILVKESIHLVRLL